MPSRRRMRELLEVEERELSMMELDAAGIKDAKTDITAIIPEIVATCTTPEDMEVMEAYSALKVKANARSNAKLRMSRIVATLHNSHAKHEAKEALGEIADLFDEVAASHPDGHDGGVQDVFSAMASNVRQNAEGMDMSSRCVFPIREPLPCRTLEDQREAVEVLRMELGTMEAVE